MTSLAGRRVALYARFSSDRQNEASVDDQLARCRRWVLEHGGATSPALTFADRAVSAASMDRAGWAALERQIGAGLVDVIVVESLDRVSRKTGDVLQLVERLRFAGVVLHALSDGIDTSTKSAKMQTTIRGLVGDLYLDDLADKTRRGMESRARAGQVTGGLPYGFRSSAAAAGGFTIEIDQAAAAVVRRIFAAYVAGSSANAIAAALNADRIPSPRSSRRDRETAPAWQHRTIAALLENETYVGRWVWNRREWRKLPGTNKRVCRERPRAEWVIQERPELALVEAATWEACNVRSGAAARAAGVLTSTERRGNGRRSYLLSGLLRCGSCQALMAIHGGGLYYRCSTASSRGTCSNRLTVREDVVRAAVLEQVRATLCAPELLADVRATMLEVLAEESGAAAGELPARREQLARLEAKIERLVDAITEGDSPALAAKLRELERETRTVRGAIAQLHASADVGESDLPSVDELLAGALEVAQVFTGADVAAGRERLRAVLDVGAVVATPAEGRYRLECDWLPTMLVPAATVRQGRSDHQIAGAGFTKIRAVSYVAAAVRKVA